MQNAHLDFSTHNTNMTKDIFSSIVVFLVALPISLGVAVASGVEPQLGVLSAIVGAVVVSLITGAPLQISGPSTGLAVMVLHVVQQYGVESLIPLAIITGLFQIAIALLKWGHLFQATPPSLVKAMLSGIGFLIIISQVYILLGQPVSSESYMNIINLPSVIIDSLTTNLTPVITHSVIIAALVVVILLFWESRKALFFHFVPGSLVAIMLSSIIAFSLGWDVPKIVLSGGIGSIFESLNYKAAFGAITIPFIFYAIGFAFVASVETMLCVSALDRMVGTNSKYNKTILAQGVGNMFAGLIGAIPVVGVISRSAANVEAGAKTRVSGILNGVWMTVVIFVPVILEFVPIAALVGLLFYIGYRLLDPSHIIDYVKNYNRTSLIFAITFILTITLDLLIGVVAGFVVATLLLLFDVLKFDLQVVERRGNKELKFTGKLSFLDLPVINKELLVHGDEEMPTNLEVCLREVQYLDPAIEDRLIEWKKNLEKQGHKVKIKSNS